MKLSKTKSQENILTKWCAECEESPNLEMKLAVDAISVSIDQFKGVWAVAVHVTVAIRYTSVTEQEGHLHRKYKVKKTKQTLSTVFKKWLWVSNSYYLVQALRPQTHEVPDHVRVFHVGLRVSFLAVDEGRELRGETRAHR